MCSRGQWKESGKAEDMGKVIKNWSRKIKFDGRLR